MADLKVLRRYVGHNRLLFYSLFIYVEQSWISFTSVKIVFNYDNLTESLIKKTKNYTYMSGELVEGWNFIVNTVT